MVKLEIEDDNQMKENAFYPHKPENKTLCFFKVMNDSNRIALYFSEQKDKKIIYSFEFID